MKIDHMGIVVYDLNEGINQWITSFGYEQETKPVENIRQQVWVVFLTKKDSLTIKLISPSKETSPVYRFAKRGGGLHHICFKVDNISETIIKFKEQGMKMLTDPQPGEAFCNDLIAFVSAKNGLNIEIIDSDCRANKVNNI